MTINPATTSRYGSTATTHAATSTEETADFSLTVASEDKEDKVHSKEQADAHKGKDACTDKSNIDAALLKLELEENIRQLRHVISPCTDMGPVSVSTEAVNPDLFREYEKIDSVYDIPASEVKYRLEAALRETSHYPKGTTELEIYKDIESVFTKYLGKDFLEPSLLYGSGMSSDSEAFPLSSYEAIHREFNSRISQYGIRAAEDGSSDHSVIIEAKGFSGMSDSEMRAAVRNKYPKDMTLKDSILMSYELCRVGLETTSYGAMVVDNSFLTLASSSKEDPNTAEFELKAKKIFDRMLQMPVEFDDMKKAMDVYKTPDGRHQFTHQMGLSKEETLTELFGWFGGGKPDDKAILAELMRMLDTL